jgi:hypothetical protein
MIRVDVGRDGGIVFIEKKMVKENCLSLFMWEDDDVFVVVVWWWWYCCCLMKVDISLWLKV